MLGPKGLLDPDARTIDKSLTLLVRLLPATRLCLFLLPGREAALKRLTGLFVLVAPPEEILLSACLLFFCKRDLALRILQFSLQLLGAIVTVLVSEGVFQTLQSIVSFATRYFELVRGIRVKGESGRTIVTWTSRYRRVFF